MKAQYVNGADMTRMNIKALRISKKDRTLKRSINALLQSKKLFTNAERRDQWFGM